MEKSNLNETTALTFYNEYNKLCKVNVGISSVETRRMVWDVILLSFVYRYINNILFERMYRHTTTSRPFVILKYFTRLGYGIACNIEMKKKGTEIII